MTGRKPKPKSMSDAEAIKLYELTRSTPTGITRELVSTLSAPMSQPETHAPLRMALAMLSMDQAELFDKVANDRATAVAFADGDRSFEDYERLLLSVAELIKVARFRVNMALSWRPDMEAVVAEARS